jgi:hypothetical protein
MRNLRIIQTRTASLPAREDTGRGATLFDVSDLPMMEVEGRYDMLRVYIPRGQANAANR